MLTQDQIRVHYLNPKVMNTIIRVSDADGCSRAAAKYTEYVNKEGENKSLVDWYKGTGARTTRGKLQKINLASRQDYINTVGFRRTIYWTLNLFDKEIFSLDYQNIGDNEGKARSAAHTQAYTFGVDIDAGHDCDIHNPEVKKAVEAIAQYYSDKLRKYLPNSVYVLYSGGGIYVMLHHKALSSYFEKYQKDDDWLVRLQSLYDALNSFIDDTRDEFFLLHPEFVGLVKPDAINSVQRLFKCIFSVHKKHDYAVVPLNPQNIHINFQNATLPLCSAVLRYGELWYTKYDDGTAFIDKVLTPHLKVASVKAKRAYIAPSEPVRMVIPFVPIEDQGKWAPCMRNLYNLPTCGEGQTRALAAFASFIGQIGIEREKAQSMFNELVVRWGARASNIFESYYKVMKVPTCESLNSNPDIGFPKGVSIKNLCVCRPDSRCISVPSPRYYTDKDANIQRLLAPKPENTKVKKEVKVKPL